MVEDEGLDRPHVAHAFQESAVQRKVGSIHIALLKTHVVFFLSFQLEDQGYLHRIFILSPLFYLLQACGQMTQQCVWHSRCSIR